MEQSNKEHVEIKLPAYAFFAIFAYVGWTFFLIFNRVPFFDEVNGWNIAQNCSFMELLKVSRHEGHFLLWYLLIKPFAQNNIGFPISMYVVNWIFSFVSVVLLWFRAPFNPLIKSLITFSIPVLMYSVYARCYSLGMFILFLLCSIYQKRFAHPVIFSFLIILLANTSVIGSIVAFSFGIVYLFEYVLNKNFNKSFYQTLSVDFVGVILVLAQMGNFVVPSYSSDAYRVSEFFKFLLTFSFFRTLSLLLLGLLLIFSIRFFDKSKYMCTYLLLGCGLILFTAYKIFTLAYWHYLFLFIILISAMWIYTNEYKLDSLFSKIYYGMFIVMCACLPVFFGANWCWNGFHVPITTYLKHNISEYNNSNIFLFPTDSSIIGLVPSMRDYNINFYDAKGLSYRSYMVYEHQWDKDKINLNNVKNVILTNSSDRNYLFIPKMEEWKHNEEKFNKYIKKHGDSNLVFMPVKTQNEVKIYRIFIKNPVK